MFSSRATGPIEGTVTGSRFEKVIAAIQTDAQASQRLTVYLGFVSPCLIIHSNKSTNQMHQSLRFIARRLNTAQHVSGILLPIIRGL